MVGRGRRFKAPLAKRGENVRKFSELMSNEKLLLKEVDIKKIWNPHFKTYGMNVDARGARAIRVSMIKKAKKDENRALEILKSANMLVNEENIRKLKQADFLIESEYKKIKPAKESYPPEWVELLKKTMIWKLKNKEFKKGEYKHV